MELRYLGFDQSGNMRGYRFDVLAKGSTTRHFVVTVDLALFRAHRVGIQEGPSLCARKLAADIESHSEGTHELTTKDMQAYADARTAAEVRRLESRKGNFRRGKAPASHPPVPWQNSWH
jgi:hypothetical protein